MSISGWRRARDLFRPGTPSCMRAFSRDFAAQVVENDVVVIGGGQTGHAAAIKAAQCGFKTTCIEKLGTLGGNCFSKVLPCLDEFLQFSQQEINMNALMAQKDKVASCLNKGIESLFWKNGIYYIKGFGKFTSPSEVSVDTLEGGNVVVKGKHIIIATGSAVKSLPGITIDEKKIVSPIGSLSLPEFPKKLVVIGAGHDGVEMGSFWGRLGSEVTVVEFAPEIVLPSMDAEFRKPFHCLLEKQMTFLLNTKVVGVDSSGDGVKLTVEPAAGGEKSTLEADVVLVSTGRVPSTDGLCLEMIGIQTDKESGGVNVDKRFMTTVPGVYAVGDVIAGLITHKAVDDGVACAEFIAGKAGHMKYENEFVPRVVQALPEVASLGMTEEQVIAAGLAYWVVSDTSGLGIEEADDNQDMWRMKMLFEKDKNNKNYVVGIHIMHRNAGDMIDGAVDLLHHVSSPDGTEDVRGKKHYSLRVDVEEFIGCIAEKIRLDRQLQTDHE